MNKRGLSNAIILVLVILVVIVLIAVFLIGINILIKGFAEESKLRIDIAGTEIDVLKVKYENNLISLILSRNSGQEDIEGVDIALEDEDGNTETYFINRLLRLHKPITAQINVSETALGKIIKATIYPIFKNPENRINNYSFRYNVNITNSSVYQDNLNDFLYFKPLYKLYVLPKESPFAITVLAKKDNIVYFEKAGVKMVRGRIRDENKPQADSYHRAIINMAIKNNLSFYAYGIGNEYPTNFQDYKIQLESDIDDYGSKTKYWQIGNEPDNKWDQRAYTEYASVTEYAQKLSDSYQIIKQKDFEAKVLSGGLGIWWDYDGLDEFFNNVDMNSFDIFDIHPYGVIKNGIWKLNGQWEGGYQCNAVLDLGNCKLMGIQPQNFSDYIVRVNNLMQQKEVSDKPIWITELGTYWNESIYLGNKKEELRQAEDTVKKNIIALSAGVSRIFLFAMADGEGANCANKESAFCSSLTNYNHYRRIGFYAYKTMTEFLTDTNFLEKNSYIVEDKTLEIYFFYKPNKLIIPLWLFDEYGKGTYPNVIINLTINTSNFAPVIQFDSVSLYEGINKNKIHLDYSLTNNVARLYNIKVNQTPQYIVIEKIIPPFCGDNLCNTNEDCDSCSADCGYCDSLRNGLKLYLPFDEDDSGNHIDYSYNYGDTAFVLGNVPVVSGKIDGSAVHFNRSSLISAGRYSVNSAEWNNKVTISSWIKLDGSANSNSIYRFVGAGEHYLISYQNNKWKFSLNFRSNNLVDTSTVSLTVNSSSILFLEQWYHVVGIYDDSSMKIYINGIKENEISVGGEFNQLAMTHTPDLYIGGNAEADTFKALGDVDEVRVYDRALTDEEVLSLYQLNS